MKWTTPKDLKAQLARLWDRGELLRDAITGQQRFPLRLVLKGPCSSDITERFDAVRAWVSELRVSELGNAKHWRVEWQQIQHRVQGTQTLPAQVWVDSLEDALHWLGKQRDWQRFAELLEQTRQQCPLIVSWLAKRPLQALAHESDWSRLLAVVTWLEQHPRPGIYLRQVDLPGIHSKFIESHRALLGELLDLALPPESVDPGKTGVSQFAARYGFLDKPARIRLRILDPKLPSMPGLVCPDLTLDADNFSRLELGVRRVLITENEINFLALPATIAETLAIFGAGYGWDALASARWLERCAVYYWGDIDTHGFAILDQLRGRFPAVKSFLMDRDTLDAHRDFWGREDQPHAGDLQRLTADEMRLYLDLRDNRIRDGLRLEQEHIGFGWLRERLETLLP